MDYNYFMDDMELSEMFLLTEALGSQEDKELDKLRTLGCWILSPYSKKIKPSDLIKIPSIDSKVSSIESGIMTEDRFNELKDKYKNALNKK